MDGCATGMEQKPSESPVIIEILFALLLPPGEGQDQKAEGQTELWAAPVLLLCCSGGILASVKWTGEEVSWPVHKLTSFIQKSLIEQKLFLRCSISSCPGAWQEGGHCFSARMSWLKHDTQDLVTSNWGNLGIQWP